MHNDIAKILISEEDINGRCKELAADIQEDYNNKAPILVGLLKGSFMFLGELIKYIDLNVEIDFMDITSYAGKESTGDVKILKDLDRHVRDEHILIVEDIVDTGRTLSRVKELLLSRGAASVKIITLLDKPSRRVCKIDPDYCGFVIPNEFVVGFGLDYNEHYRNLPYIGVLKEEIYKE